MKKLSFSKGNFSEKRKTVRAIPLLKSHLSICFVPPLLCVKMLVWSKKVAISLETGKHKFSFVIYLTFHTEASLRIDSIKNFSFAFINSFISVA